MSSVECETVCINSCHANDRQSQLFCNVKLLCVELHQNSCKQLNNWSNLRLFKELSFSFIPC